MRSWLFSLWRNQMQYINHWPEVAESTLPQAVSQDLQQQLLLPFNSEDEAKEFWLETYCTLIILDPTDSIRDLKQTDTWSQIEFALTYHEYTVSLSMDYTLSVTITNDSGSCIFLVIPPKLSHIITETEAHE